MATKATRNTIKAFIRKNSGKLQILHKHSFDPMIDGHSWPENPQFRAAERDERGFIDNTMGIKGAWFVRGGRDFITEFESPTHKGYEVSNSCGGFIIAILKGGN